MGVQVGREELLRRVTPRTLHGEVGTGRRVGREAL